MDKEVPSQPAVLFLCTGNYYRSRTAEILFNHLADRYDLPWEAASRGLAANITATRNEGPISILAVQYLATLGIVIDRESARMPAALRPEESSRFAHIIAVNEPEHRPMIEARFDWLQDQVRYWQVADIDQEKPASALERLRAHVTDFVMLLKTHPA